MAVMQADRGGEPLTPGRLGGHLRLSSGSATAVIDRLQRAGHVRRVRDEHDRRRVTLHHADAAAALGAAFFGPLTRRMDGMLAGYTPEQLEVVRRFLAETCDMMGRHRTEVVQAWASPPGRLE